MGYDLRYMYLYINTPKTTTMPPITRCRFDIGSLGNNQSVIANSWPCMRIKMNIHIQCQLDILQHAVQWVALQNLFRGLSCFQFLIACSMHQAI